LKREVAIPNAGAHVLGSPIRSRDVESVRKELEKFAIEILKLSPVAEVNTYPSRL
jgi:hypothetical protein